MADQTDLLTCLNCFKAFAAAADSNDRRPIVSCKNNHSLCSTCASRNSLDKCPKCPESELLLPKEVDVDMQQANPTASLSADVYAAFEARLEELELSTKAYKLVDARSQVEACSTLWSDLGDRTTATASTARFHSVKGYIHHWFGECSDAYKETYRALKELHELCSSGTRVEDEQIVSTLRYAVEVCCSQNQYTAAVALVSYAARYAKSKLSAEAYGDFLECFGYFPYYGKKWSKIFEFLLSTRLEASASKPHINVATAHYYLAQKYKVKNNRAALEHLKEAQKVINEVDEDNIWASLCKSLEAEISYAPVFTCNLSDSVTQKLQQNNETLEDALEIAEGILGKSNETVSKIYFLLGRTSEKMKNYRRAKSMYKEAIQAAENSLGPKSEFALWPLEHLAYMINYEQQKTKKAEVVYNRAIEVWKSFRGPGYSEPSYLYHGLFHTLACFKRVKDENAINTKLQDHKSIKETLNKLVDEVAKILESGNEVSEAPVELADLLGNFFEVALEPQPKTEPEPQPQPEKPESSEPPSEVVNS